MVHKIARSGKGTCTRGVLQLGESVVLKINETEALHNIFPSRYLATGKSARSLHYQFRMGNSMVLSIVYDTCECLWGNLLEKEMPRPTEETLKEGAKAFESIWQFPQVLFSTTKNIFRLFCKVWLMQKPTSLLLMWVIQEGNPIAVYRVILPLGKLFCSSNCLSHNLLQLWERFCLMFLWLIKPIHFIQT